MWEYCSQGARFFLSLVQWVYLSKKVLATGTDKNDLQAFLFTPSPVFPLKKRWLVPIPTYFTSFNFNLLVFLNENFEHEFVHFINFCFVIYLLGKPNLEPVGIATPHQGANHRRFRLLFLFSLRGLGTHLTYGFDLRTYPDQSWQLLSYITHF